MQGTTQETFGQGNEKGMHVGYTQASHEHLEQPNDADPMENWSTMNCDRLSISQLKTG